MHEPTAERVRIESHLHPDPISKQGRELIAALSEKPRHIPSQYFYDARGSELFEAITRQPEYYPTRAEAELLQHAASRIATRTRPAMLVELGSGAATKTRTLLDALDGLGTLDTYVPFDVDLTMVERVASEIVAEYPELRVHGVAGNFLQDLRAIPAASSRLIAFLGSTIGNFDVYQAEQFLRALRRQMTPADHFLLGVDLIKDRATIEAAYNDHAGVTAEFNRNILHVLNARFGFDFEPPAFEHRAVWVAAQHRVELTLVPTRTQTVHSAELNFALTLAAGEPILTEVSTKYDRDLVDAMLQSAGFTLHDWLTHEDGLFGLALT
jgi:L-histidine N-alpha-methyltransferase